MKQFHCYGKVVGTKYLGIFSAKNKKQAVADAEKEAYVSICHQCSKEISDPEIISIIAEEEK